MFGSIIKSNNRYRAYYSYCGKRFSKRFATHKEAELWLAENETKIADGSFVEPNHMTFGQWVLEYLATYVKPKRKEGTLITYKDCASRLSALSNIELQKLTPYHLQKTLNTIKQPATQHITYRFLSACLRRAYKLRFLPYNIMDGVEAPDYKPTRKKIFTDVELQRIKQTLANHKHKVFFLTMLATGCRIGELLGLKINAVHDNYITIENQITNHVDDESPKSRTSIRDIPLPTAIIKLLRDEWAKPPAIVGGYVFHHGQNARHYSSNSLNTMWHKICEQSNVIYRPPHTIRHTHATNLLHHFDYVEVQHRLGHSQASTTLNIYGHVKDEVTPEIVKAVENLAL